MPSWEIILAQLAAVMVFGANGGVVAGLATNTTPLAIWIFNEAFLILKIALLVICFDLLTRILVALPITRSRTGKIYNRLRQQISQNGITKWILVFGVFVPYGYLAGALAIRLGQTGRQKAYCAFYILLGSMIQTSLLIFAGVVGAAYLGKAAGLVSAVVIAFLLASIVKRRGISF